jgi:lycopene cyclase domain-containing protein
VGGCYIIWDVVATYRGDWWFNHEYLMDFKIAGLPIEEILFFITAPYSCIFIYESLKYFFNDRELSIDARFFIFPGLIFLAASIMVYNQYYTATVLFSCALFFFLAMLLYQKILTSFTYWLYIVIVFIPFFVMNYLLTSIPIVLYNSDAIWDVRITTIPVEDFFYNFAMLSFYLMVYLFFKDRFNKNELSH